MRFVINSWRERSLWLILLLPLAYLFRLIVFVRKRLLYKTERPENFTVPIVVIGNITVGGSGKTPLTITIANNLVSLGYKPGIVSRGYGGKFKETLKVSTDTPVKETGDEAQILAKLDVPFYIDKNRVRAVKKLTKKS